MIFLLIINLLANLPKIANYGDAISKNPLLQEYERQLPMLQKKRFEFIVGTHKFIESDAFRELAMKYSWAIPNLAALQEIAKHSPIIEIGAGSGYWAYMLSQMGARVTAYDDHSWGYPENNWFTVQKLNIYDIGFKYPEQRALFLCWPTQETGMATVALHNYRIHHGKTVIYIGDWGPNSATAEMSFFQNLVRDFDKVTDVEIPNWPGYHDRLSIWKLKSPYRN